MSLTLAACLILLLQPIFCSPAIAGECSATSERPVKNRLFGRGLHDVDGDGNPEEVQIVFVDGTTSTDDCGMFPSYFMGHTEIRVLKGSKILAKYSMGLQSFQLGGDQCVQAIAFGNYTQDGRTEFPILVNGDRYRIYAISPQLIIEPVGDAFRAMSGMPLSTTDWILADGDHLRVRNPMYNSWLRERRPDYSEVEWNLFKWNGKAFVALPSPPTPLEEHHNLPRPKASKKTLASNFIQDTADSVSTAKFWRYHEDAACEIAGYLSSKPYDSNQRLPMDTAPGSSTATYAALGVNDFNAGLINSMRDLSVSAPAVIRNEIFARHGFIFRKSPWKEIFERVAWYSPDGHFQEDLFSPQEKKNINIIRDFEKNGNR